MRQNRNWVWQFRNQIIVTLSLLVVPALASAPLPGLRPECPEQPALGVSLGDTEVVLNRQDNGANFFNIVGLS